MRRRARLLLLLLAAVGIVVGLAMVCEHREEAQQSIQQTTTMPRSVTPAPIVSHPYERIVCEAVNGTVTCRTYPPGFGG